MQSAWKSGQPSGSDIVRDGRMAQASRVLNGLVTAAEAAYTAGDWQSSRDFIIAIQSLLPAMRDAVNTLATDAAQLQERVDKLEEEVKQLRQADEARTRRILLGECAYMLDKVAVAYVMRNEHLRKGMTIGELRARAYGGQDPVV